MDNTVLVLGGGFIGGNVANQFAQAGHKVTVLTQSRVTQTLIEAQELNPGSINIIHGDLRQPETTLSILKRYGNSAHIIQHAAKAFGSSQTNSTNPTDFEGNAQINDNVIRMIASGDVRPASLSFSSSYFIYDALKNPCPQDGYREENIDPLYLTDEQLAELKTENPYKWEKIRTERELIRKLGRIIPIYRTRFGNVMGRHQRRHPTHHHFIPDLVHKWIQGGKGTIQATIFGDGTASRAWTDVGDIASGVRHLIEKELPSGVYNIGGTASAPSHTTVEILDALGRALDVSVIKTYDPRAHGGHSLNLNTDKIRGTGWIPRVTLDKSMERIVSGYLEYGTDSSVSE